MVYILGQAFDAFHLSEGICRVCGSEQGWWAKAGCQRELGQACKGHV